MPAAITQATGVFLTDSSCGLKQCAGYLKVKKKKRNYARFLCGIHIKVCIWISNKIEKKQKLQIYVFYLQMELFKMNGDLY